MTGFFVCDKSLSVRLRSREFIVTVFAGVMEATTPPVSGTVTFDPWEAAWGPNELRQTEAGSLYSWMPNLKSAGISEGTRIFPMDVWK